MSNEIKTPPNEWLGRPTIMKTTLKSYIHALNILEDSRDVYVSGYESICIECRCGGKTITDEGRKEWADVLRMKIEDETISSTDEKNARAWDFLSAMAGYCSCEDYDKWFEGGKLI